METSSAVLAVLLVYSLLLTGIGLWARGRNQGVEDFYLGGRKLGPWIAAISASASSSSAWTLLGVSGAAYAWGLPALWLLPATLGGFLFNWYWAGPRLRRLSADEGALTLSEVVASPALGADRRTVLRFASAIIVFCFIFYVASQFEAAGKAFESVFGISRETSIGAGAVIVLVYIMLGGFWAVSVTDTLQGLLMCLAAVVLPCISLWAVGGPGPLVSALGEGAGVSTLPPGTLVGLSGLLFVAGILGIGIGYPGQPHVVNRFMAIRSESDMRRGRVIAITWAVLVYSGMLLMGFCARVLLPELDDSEVVMFRLAAQLLPAALAGIILAAVLSAIMSTADSQLLVAGSAVSHDWSEGQDDADRGLTRSRITVAIILLLATILALVWQADIFSRVLFAWSALGSAFGPLLIMRLVGREVSTAGTLGSMLTGFGLTVLISFFPSSPGDFAERILPFSVALVIAFLTPSGTGQTRRNL